MGKYLIVWMAALFSMVACAQQSADASLQGKKVLFVYGGWDGHEPVPSRIENIAQIDRGYEDIEHRLNALGAKITRVCD